MNVKNIIQEFYENTIDHLELARKIILVGEPTLGCDLNEMVKDNDNRMKAVSYFLYNYQLMEINIKNYKEYSKPSNYDKETLDIIKDNIEFCYSEYKKSIIKLKEI